LIGMLSYLLGALDSSLIGLFHDGTARPMAILIMGSMLASAFSLFVIARPASGAA
jgi:DHA1 family bicyclomycin/chloramphenicol resistance-like MFS transporter